MNRDLYIKRLTSILIYQGFQEAALALDDIIRGCSTKDIQDKVEEWKAYERNKSSF